MTLLCLITGNHYGTPKPSKESKATGSGSTTLRPPDEVSSSTTGSNGVIHFPGAHPSSEGKRRRNRSNVEAMTAKNLQEEVEKEELNTMAGKNFLRALLAVIFYNLIFCILST